MPLHHPNQILATGLVILAIGLYLRFKINQRRFNRRAVTGLEQFSSYGKAVFTRGAEAFFMIVAKILILMGILLILARLL